MKISCPSCSAKYSIADEKVQNRLAKIRCRKCGTSIVIDGNVSPAAVYAGEPEVGGSAPAAAAAPSGTVYTVDFGENDQRQLSLADVVAAYNAGSVTAETYLWTDGFADWTPLGQVEEVVAALNAAAGVTTSALGASTAPQEDPWADAAAVQAPATPAAAPVAARGADLFGGIDRAGAEAEIATSASSGSSAIASGGLASGLGGFGGASSSAATGARNESSVLFSLSALTASAGTSRPSNPPPLAQAQHVTEDSGLIDLKALTAAAEHRPAPAVPVAAAPLGLGGSLPLGGGPLGNPYASVGGPSLPPRAAKSNTGLYLAIGGVIAVLGSVLIFRLTEREDPPPPPPPVTSTAPTAPAAPLPPPLPAAADLPAAEPTTPSAPSEAAAENAKTTSAPRTTTSTKKPAPASPSSSSSSSSTSTPSSSSSSSASAPAKTPAPAKKSGGNCGCAANDLMCNMRCSAK